MLRKRVAWGIGTVGFGFLFLAVWARQLGVARSADWGSGRIIVAGAGIVFLLVALLVYFWDAWTGIVSRSREALRRRWQVFLALPAPLRFLQAGTAVAQRMGSAWEGWLPVRWSRSHLRPPLDRARTWIRNSRAWRFFADSQEHSAWLAAAVLGSAILVLYIWVVSVGWWSPWPKTTSYYQLLGDAFAKGQLNLLLEPDPSLLSLEDPYSLNNRQAVPYLWDALLYQGRYYLYWGPVPALALVALRPIVSNAINDQVLVFAFVSGAFLHSCLLILAMRRHLFPGLGWSTVIPGILLAGLAHPLPWLLSRPAVYEAAISAGQFFLLAGLYHYFQALTSPRPGLGRLLLASTCIALAVASRASLGLTGVFLFLVLAVWILRTPGSWGKRLVRLAALGAPLAFGLLGMGWYNQARFGSWFEFGFRYMLTGMDLNSQTFSPANIGINLHNYLLNPYRTLPAFPFLEAELGGHFIFFPIPAPANYYAEQVSGLLLTLPYLLLSVLPVVYLIGLALRRQWLPRSPRPSGTGSDPLGWTAAILAGAALLSFLPLLLFISATMRYQADVVPALVLLSTMGFWIGRQHLVSHPQGSTWLSLLVWMVTIGSIAVSLLLAFTGADARFEHLNPGVYESVARFFTP